MRHVFSESGAPRKLGPFPIDVIEASYGPSEVPVAVDLEDIAVLERTGSFDPLVGGISVGNPRVTAGTLGAIVWDRTDCSVSLISNWHVLAGSDAAAPGEAIYQPGVADGGGPADTVATLTRFRLEATMDAAIARLNGARGYSRDIIGLNPIPGVEQPLLGMNVTKSGRTTGVTEGVIDGVSFSGRKAPVSKTGAPREATPLAYLFAARARSFYPTAQGFGPLADKDW